MAGLVRCHLRGVVLTRKARRVILREREGLKLDTGVVMSFERILVVPEKI
jgi:hypothetical protein